MKQSWEQKSQEKIIVPEQLPKLIASLRANHQTIATLNGSFDLLHGGHLHMIYEASLQADILLVALNTDASIQKYKAKNRPIIPLKYRLQMMAALQFVDYVTYFEETDPRQMLSQIQPDVHVNGREYGENCVEAEVVKRHGGRIHIVSLLEGLSTSTLIQKIQTCVQ